MMWGVTSYVYVAIDKGRMFHTYYSPFRNASGRRCGQGIRWGLYALFVNSPAVTSVTRPPRHPGYRYVTLCKKGVITSTYIPVLRSQESNFTFKRRYSIGVECAIAKRKTHR